MKLSIIGASAGVGLETVREALRRGHAVTTLSRTVATLPDDAALTRITGSSTDPAAVAQAIAGADAILVTLGRGRDTKPTTLFTDSARVLLDVLGRSDARPPLIVLTGFGAGDSWNYNSWPMRIMFRLFLKAVYADKGEMERKIAAGYRDSEFVRPGRLTDGPAMKAYQVLIGLDRRMKVGAISRADVADYLVTEAEQRRYIGRYPALTG